MKDLFGNDDIEAMYQMAIQRPLSYKIEQSIKIAKSVESIAMKYSTDGIYGCTSFGKDSIVLQKILEMANVKYVMHTNITTLDAPELIYFGKKHYPNVIWHKPEMSLLSYMVKKGKGMPTRRGRWCCEVYKEHGGDGCLKAVGVRADESARRKGLWQQVKVDARTRLPVIAPLLYWTDANIWEFIKANNMPYCELYNEGFKRLGCIGCPLNNKGRLVEFKRWPKYEQMWRDACRKMWETWKDVPRLRDGGERIGLTKFKKWEDYWLWWMEEENINDTEQPDCQMFLW